MIKKLIYVLAVVVLLSGCVSQKPVEIIPKSLARGVEKEPLFVASVFGIISDPNTIEKGKLWKFSCIKENGRLDEKKYRNFLRQWAHWGANATREPCFFVNLIFWQVRAN